MSIGFLLGLVLSTRYVFVVVFIIAFVFLLKTKFVTFKQLALVGTSAVVTFGLTFVPFVYNHFAEFALVNPFVTQSTALMPFAFTIPFVLLAIVFWFIAKAVNDTYFYSGLVLFLTIVGYFLYHISQEGLQTAFSRA